MLIQTLKFKMTAISDTWKWSYDDPSLFAHFIHQKFNKKWRFHFRQFPKISTNLWFDILKWCRTYNWKAYKKNILERKKNVQQQQIVVKYSDVIFGFL